VDPVDLISALVTNGNNHPEHIASGLFVDSGRASTSGRAESFDNLVSVH